MTNRRPFVAMSVATALLLSGCESSSPEVVSPETVTSVELEAADSLVVPEVTTVVDSRTQTEFMLDTSFSQTEQVRLTLERGAGMVAVNHLVGGTRLQDGAAVRIFVDYDGSVDLSTFAGGPNGIEVTDSVSEFTPAELENGTSAILSEPLDNDTSMGVIHVRQSGRQVDVAVQWDVSDMTFAQSIEDTVNIGR